MDKKTTARISFTRRMFITLGSLLLTYPLIRFIAHRIPRKPVILEVHEPLKTGGFLIQNDFIIFSRNQKTWAVSRTCTHLGCKLNYKEKDNILECPCHQSMFSTNGEVIKGPAKRSLSIYKTVQNIDPPSFTITI